MCGGEKHRTKPRRSLQSGHVETILIHRNRLDLQTPPRQKICCTRAGRVLDHDPGAARREKYVSEQCQTLGYPIDDQHAIGFDVHPPGPAKLTGQFSAQLDMTSRVTITKLGGGHGG